MPTLFRLPLVFSLVLGAAAADRPAFDSAIMRPTPVRSGVRFYEESIKIAPGRLTTTRASVRTLLTWAYGMQSYQVAGPAWIDSVRFDIQAKTAHPATAGDLKLMTQSLLEDRLRLELRSEMKRLRVLALEVAKDGLKAETSTNGTTTPEFAAMLSLFSEPLGLAVIDATGLTGTFDLNPDLSKLRRGPLNSFDAPPVLTSLREALAPFGLQLKERSVTRQTLTVVNGQKSPVN